MDGSSSGTQFDFTFAPGVSEEQILGFEMAGELWSSYLDDDVKIDIYVEATNELPENVLGGALPGIQGNLNYKELQDAIVADSVTGNDAISLANLPSGGKGSSFKVMVDGNELDKTRKVKLTNANAKALDLIDGRGSQLDGYIVINDLSGVSGINWDYDPLRTDSVRDNEVDFLTVATHEIGHVLGFVSGVDDRDWLTTLTRAEDTNGRVRDTAVKFATPLDLFRYSDQSAAVGQVDFSLGADSFFSIDGGNSNLGEFSTGEYGDFGGDGFQASHWKNKSNTLGVMQPLIGTGVTQDITELDLKALDVIGWDVVGEGVDRQAIYDAASENAANAKIVDRSGDVDKLISNNEQYDGRISRYSSNNYFSWQTGFWQFNTVEGLDSPVPIAEAESSGTIESADTDAVSTSQNDAELEAQANLGDEENAIAISQSNTQFLSTDETESSDSLLLDNSVGDRELSDSLGDSLVMPLL